MSYDNSQTIMKAESPEAMNLYQGAHSMLEQAANEQEQYIAAANEFLQEIIAGIVGLR